jgi:hypothetical protein
MNQGLGEMDINILREILNDVGYIQHEFNNSLETYHLVSASFGDAVSIQIKNEQGDIYVDFYFSGSNLYASYKLSDLSKFIIICEINKFIKNDKIKVLYRDSLIEEIIN